MAPLFVASEEERLGLRDVGEVSDEPIVVAAADQGPDSELIATELEPTEESVRDMEPTMRFADEPTDIDVELAETDTASEEEPLEVVREVEQELPDFEA